MNKILSVMTLALMMVLTLGAVSAQTLIAGKIYNADFSDTVSGADVTVTCNGNTQTTTSLGEGAYSVTYNEIDTGSCNDGDSLTVSAIKGDLSGSETGIIHDNVFDTWDLAIVNVPLVPEFGAIIGALTVLGALGMFFVVRKK